MKRKASIERGWRENHQWKEDEAKSINRTRVERKSSVERE